MQESFKTQLFSKKSYDLIVRYYRDFQKVGFAADAFEEMAEQKIETAWINGLSPHDFFVRSMEKDLGQSNFVVISEQKILSVSPNGLNKFVYAEFPLIKRSFKSCTVEGYRPTRDRLHIVRASSHGKTGLSVAKQFKILLSSFRDICNILTGSVMENDSFQFSMLNGQDGGWRFKPHGKTTRLGKFWELVGFDLNGKSLKFTTNNPPKNPDEFPELIIDEEMIPKQKNINDSDFSEALDSLKIQTRIRRLVLADRF